MGTHAKQATPSLDASDAAATTASGSTPAQPSSAKIQSAPDVVVYGNVLLPRRLNSVTVHTATSPRRRVLHLGQVLACQWRFHLPR